MSEWHRRLRRELEPLEVAPERLHDLVDELAQDLEERARIARSTGASAQQAEERAWSGLGSPDELRARLRELEADASRRAAWRAEPLGQARATPLSGFGRELRQAARSLRRSPGYAAVALLTLAMGIGVNTTLFSFVNALFFTPLPVPEPDRLVAVFTSRYGGGPDGTSSYPDFEEIRDQEGLFDGLAGYTFEAIGMRTEREPARVWAEFVTGRYFETLRLPMELGRPLGPEDDREDARPALVLSHGLWQRRLAGDPEILGRTLMLSGTAFTVVGVAPETFGGMRRGVPAEVWLPMASRDALVPGGGAATRDRGNHFLSLVGRLAPGVGLPDAASRLDVIAKRLHDSYPDPWTDQAGRARRLSLVPESQARISPRGADALVGFSALLALVAGVVLLIACANVGNLMLARASARRREIALRLALGASRPRVLRHFLAESLLVAGLGGGLGLLLATWASRVLSAVSPPSPVPLHLDVAVDARVLGFALGLSLVTGVLLGLAPGLQAIRQDLTPALKDAAAGPTTSARGRRLGRLFVTTQVALSTVLLIGASLLLRGMARATEVSPGFDVDAPQIVPVDVGLAGYDVAQTSALIERLAERLPALPGVRAAGLTVALPLELHVIERPTRVEGHVPRPGEDDGILFGVVGPGHFEALRIPILRGRGFEPADRADSPLVVVVNERFAEQFWPGQDPIGRRVQLGDAEAPWREVVGVAADSKYRNLGEDPTPFTYVPVAQDFAYVERFARFFPLHVVVRGDGDPGALTRTVSAALAEIDPDLPVFPARSLRDWLGLSLLPARVASGAFGAFGLLGLLLASLGVYGVVAYSVARRTREIGVRMAMGAEAGDVLGLMLRDGIRLAGVGLALGVALSFALARGLEALLYGLPPFDPVSFTVVPAALALVALAASALPARRAVRVDPVEALRCD